MKNAAVIVLAVLAVGGVGAGAFFLLSQKKKTSKLPTVEAAKTILESVAKSLPTPEPAFGHNPIAAVSPNVGIIGGAWATIDEPPKQLPPAGVGSDFKSPGKSFEPPTIIRLPAGVISPVHSIVPPPIVQRPAEPLVRPVTVIKVAPVVEHPTFTATTRPAPSKGQINTHSDVPVFRPTPAPSVDRTYQKEVELSGFSTRPNTASPATHIAPYVNFGGRAPSKKGFDA